MSNDDDEQMWNRFSEAVNMTAAQLEAHLKTDDSRAVGQRDRGRESTGHASGRRIIQILHRKKDDLTDSDYQHMRKVAGYVKRHLAQRPDGDVGDSAWRYSLMNWGHDPQQ